jgi:uncharacterized membrane protein YidH (DUF202 family)
MDTPVEEKPGADLRDYLAEERTFLAWIRTGLTLMGFGFVVARFGLFLRLHDLKAAAAGYWQDALASSRAPVLRG